LMYDLFFVWLPFMSIFFLTDYLILKGGQLFK
jgi:hypothetical protein